ncbi:putative polyamine oxidase 5 [Prunus yedoensis var. nudiflora]|uniref:Putative polyamine oxidase 5 n=1 Tax=Prunus yedoensis var. nudiflora TaxID=2094558 RepID=A0A314ZJI1_PRUYE|nr:putative polyamine oxidase 5 [Prunus yedoensis var. nudiflora]
MVAKKSRIVIIGAGMAGVTAANKLFTATGSKDLFELCVVEGGSRIGGRINTSEFGGDRIEMGATWIHGIGGSPVHKIAQEIHALESEQPWECMDGSSDEAKTVAECGFELNPTLVDPISSLFKNLMDYAQGKKVFDESTETESKGDVEYGKLGDKASEVCTSNGGLGKLSVGSFLRQGLEAYWVSKKNQDEELKLNGYGNWSRRLLEEAIFAMHESTQRTYTSAGDLLTLDYSAESEYRMFPGEEITIAKGYLSIVQSLASVLPPGLIQLGRKVTKIEWQQPETHINNGYDDTRPVKLHFSDGSVMLADHVIVTVSLGVLKASIQQDSGMFNPPLPSFKTEAISRLGFGVVNKLFLQLSSTHATKGQDFSKFPFLQMVFHRADSEFRHKKIPWWMRKTASLCPLYHNSSVLLSWFAGKEALELESLKDEEIINGVSATVSSFLSKPQKKEKENCHSHELCNGNVNSKENSEVKIAKVLKSQWGNDPLFLGSYSYVAVGSSGEDLDTMAEPLPKLNSCGDEPATSPPLQILFAGEATHRTHYSTTHGAYFSGLREANRLLQHYHHLGV